MMRIDVRSRVLPITSSLQQLTIRRVLTVVRGLEPSLQSLLINFEPEPDGNVAGARSCTIHCSSVWGRIDVEDTGVDVYSALQGALGKLGRVLARHARSDASVQRHDAASAA